MSALELAVLVFGLAGAWLWSDSLRVRERALGAYAHQDDWSYL